MKLDPKGSWIQVDLLCDKEEEESTLIALPDDWKPAEKPYKIVSVVADPCREYVHGDTIVVPTHIVREIEVKQNKFYLVERNHVLAQVLPE